MYTIKLKYQASEDFQAFLPLLRKQYTSVYHYAYNRLQEGMSKQDIYHLILDLKNVDLMKSRMFNDAIDDANKIYERDKESKHQSIFGSRHEFIRRCKGLITKEEWQEKRLREFYTQGETSYYGNRYFTFNLDKKQFTFKYDRNKHFILDFKASKNQMTDLIQLQDLCEEKKGKFTVSVSDQEINISLDEMPIKEVVNYKQNRFIGIDLNPTNIGVSVLEFTDKLKVLTTQDFNFKAIIDGIFQGKDWNKKLDYEIFEISKAIAKLAKHWQCQFIFVEDLSFKSQSKTKGKKWNRTTKNLWKRNKFIDNLTKRCKINQQKIFLISPEYSSIIGNCMYEYIDPVNASIEIGRRGYEIIILRTKKFYPAFELKNTLIHRWKEMVDVLPDNWKEFFRLLKNMKLSYRVSLEECLHPFDVFRQKVRKVEIYHFR